MWKQLLIGGSLMLSMAAKAQNADVVRGEYWIDTDAGFGNEIAFSPALVPGADVTASITVHARRASRVASTVTEWSSAVAASHGISDAFSTGSQNHQPPQPSS